jgi:hypothetical protein
MCLRYATPPFAPPGCGLCRGRCCCYGQNNGDLSQAQLGKVVSEQSIKCRYRALAELLRAKHLSINTRRLSGRALPCHPSFQTACPLSIVQTRDYSLIDVSLSPYVARSYALFHFHLCFTTNSIPLCRGRILPAGTPFIHGHAILVSRPPRVYLFFFVNRLLARRPQALFIAVRRSFCPLGPRVLYTHDFP